ncbi:hypothetical protein HY227_02060 [Candidatus Wolfebacteria bacterium]|nr:hypothetical protein [Candidatus Wolfebacteria bacterium]
MRNITVIYHKNCPDGFGAAWAAWKKFGDKAEYFGVEHKDSVPKGLKNKEIYTVDFCYDDKELKTLIKSNKKVIVIDHHISRKEAIVNMPGSVFGGKNSGSVLAWKYFHPDKKTPKLLKHIEDTDLYNLNLPKTEELIASLETYDYSFKLWNKIASDFENPRKIKKYEEEGKAMIKQVNKTVKTLVERAQRAVFEKHKTLVVNSPVLASKIGNYIIKVKKYPLAIIWSVRNQDGKIYVQLRSGEKVNVYKLAERFGGGGHKQAAGFFIKPDIKFPWKNDK